MFGNEANFLEQLQKYNPTDIGIHETYNCKYENGVIISVIDSFSENIMKMKLILQETNRGTFALRKHNY